MATALVDIQVPRELIRTLEGDGLQGDVRDGMVVGANVWHKRVLPGHFEASAPRKYGGTFTRRSKKTRKRKLRSKGHNKPMVSSGEMRNQILRGRTSSKALKRPTSLTVNYKLPHAPHVNFWRNRLSKTGRVIDFPKELTAMLPREERQIAKITEREVAKRMRERHARGGTVKRTFRA
jgi:hypothetical protein